MGSSTEITIFTHRKRLSMGIERRNRLMVFPRMGKWAIILVSIGFIVAGIRAFQLYGYIFENNVKHTGFVYIPDSATYDQVIDSLKAGDFLANYKSIKWVANKKKYPDLIKPGAYKLEKNWSNNKLIDVLRSGAQTPIKVIFNNIRFRKDLAARLSHYLEADSAAFLKELTDTVVAQKYGFTYASFPAMFIPNTYELYWTTTPVEFVDRMKQEFDRFWTNERKKKAEAAGMTPVQATTLASIVQEETVKPDEMHKIAGVYINRLKRGWRLQADPTVKFAVGDFSIKRILNQHLEIESPYNTYKYKGLPPGPINFPNPKSIDAVLNYEKSKYLYFCAKEDFSGYHNFSRTLREHNRNAARYQRALNKNRIFK